MAGSDAGAARRTALPGRYGRDARRTTRRRLWLVAALGAAVLLAWLGWSVVRAASPEVRVADASFAVQGPDRVRLGFAVTRRDPRATVRCAVSAENDRHTVVGYRLVTVPPGRAHEVLAVTIRTQEPAVAAQSERCWVVAGR